MTRKILNDVPAGGTEIAAADFVAALLGQEPPARELFAYYRRFRSCGYGPCSSISTS